MKTPKTLPPALSAFLAALLLAGCLNPVSFNFPAPAAEPGSGAETADGEPFTVVLTINGDGSARIDGGGSARAAAGLESATIKTSGSGARNYMQLITAQGGALLSFSEVRQTEDAASPSFSVEVVSGKTYDFLLLMGHWEREYDSYTYKDGPPTLLAAGLKSQTIQSGGNTVAIVMHPVVVDTEFTKTGGSGTGVKDGGGVFQLDPGDWDLRWTAREAGGASPFDTLTAAQGRISGQEGAEGLILKGAAAAVGGGAPGTAGIDLRGNVITLDLGVLGAGDAGHANFNLTYAPFGIVEEGKWEGYSSFYYSGGVPVWIIRNGVNDLAQDGGTDFSAPADWGLTANGNGAVGFTVSAPSILIPDTVLVEGGTFQMGSGRSGNYFQENPIRQVTVSSFWMGKYEVTQEEWYSLMWTTAADLLGLRNLLYPPTEQNNWKVEVLYGEGEKYPIYYVTWYEAVEFCNRLSAAAGLKAAYTIDKGTDPWTVACDFTAPGYRLPTEAEWEYAARGGNTGTNFVYSGSDNVDDAAWYKENSGGNTHPAGGKAPNDLALYDMSGNVNEWCWDWSQPDYYGVTSTSVENPTGPADNSVSGNFRATRGGDFVDTADNVWTTDRGGIAPHARFRSLGFRVVRPQP